MLLPEHLYLCSNLIYYCQAVLIKMSCANRNFNGITGSKSNGNGGGAGGCGISCENTEERIRILAEMKAKLSPLEYQVTQEKVTERLVQSQDF